MVSYSKRNLSAAKTLHTHAAPPNDSSLRFIAWALVQTSLRHGATVPLSPA